MTYPVKNYGSTAPVYKNYGKDPDNDPEINNEDPQNPTPGDNYTPPEDGGPVSVADLRQEIKSVNDELIHNKDLKPADRSKLITKLNALNGRINAAMGATGEKRAAKLAQIEQDLGDIEGQIVGDPSVGGPDGAEDSPEPTVDLKQLKKDLNRAIDDINSRTNLTDDEKIELRAPLEKDLTEIEVAKKDPSKIDSDKIQSDIDEAKKNTEEKDAYSPGLKGLAEAFNMEPEIIRGKAEAKGIDLNNLTLPPSMELLNFLTDLSPDLKDAFKKAETAVSDRIKSIQDNQKTMGDIASANMNKDTSANCNVDVSPWQNLFNLKHFQDDKSKAVASAMQDLVKTLTPIFKALFPGQEVKAVEDNSPGGWQKAQGEYSVADKIQIGGTTIDLINNTTGKMQNSTSADADIPITFSDLWGDGEGDGEWAPPQLQTYGDAQPTIMDNDKHGAW